MLVLAAGEPPPNNELAALRRFAARIRAELSESGHVTKDEVSAALAELDAELKQ
jgi:hypothetical protein